MFGSKNVRSFKNIKGTKRDREDEKYQVLKRM
jgi:hypothetical protein